MASHFLEPILSCLGLTLLKQPGQQDPDDCYCFSHEPEYSDKDCLPAYSQPSTDIDTETDAMATSIMHALLNASTPQDLHKTLSNHFSAMSWTTTLAQSILKKLEHTLSNVDPSKFGNLLKDAFERATREAVDFAREHPVYCTIIALGILVMVMPWVLQVLGFAEVGIVKGECIRTCTS